LEDYERRYAIKWVAISDVLKCSGSGIIHVTCTLSLWYVAGGGAGPALHKGRGGDALSFQSPLAPRGAVMASIACW